LASDCRIGRTRIKTRRTAVELPISRIRQGRENVAPHSLTVYQSGHTTDPTTGEQNERTQEDRVIHGRRGDDRRTGAGFCGPSQSPGSMLTIVDQNITGVGYNRVIVQGVYPMQKPDAVGYLNNLTAGCGGMHYIVWGDDGNEQYLFDRNCPGVHNDIDGFVRASDRGLEYLQQFVMPASALNEDKDGTDEVFVRARFVDGDCGSRVKNTNVVKGNF
jgi:hypothetical protein